jgi:transcriptional regulator with XRE-family HTH domain
MTKSRATAPTYETTLCDLPQTLRTLRKLRELTLKEVAADTGLSVSFLSDIERGRTNPSFDTLTKLAKRYYAWIKVTF